MDQLAQIVFVTVLSPIDNLLFNIARLTITNFRILLSFFKLSKIPSLVHFTDPRSAFVLSASPTRLATLTRQKVRAVNRHMDRKPFSFLVTFFVQRDNRLLMRVVLRKPLLRVSHARIWSHLASVAAALLRKKRNDLMKHRYVLRAGTRRSVVVVHLPRHSHFRKPVLSVREVPAAASQGMFSVDVFAHIFRVSLG